tara:strand:- start:416 stop:1219 length:804 start_codon:yes stop_codon:yes gene_type:complete
MLGLNYLGKMGQLGNQMFQYAALRGIASNKGYEWCIPNHQEIFDDGIGNKLRIELFDCFKLDSVNVVGMLHNGHAPIVQEKHYHFDQQLLDLCPDEISLVGYFQSEKWFKHIESEIRNDFTFHDEILKPCKEMMSGLENSIALHVRRGDFLRNSARHYNQSLSYYEKALKHFPDETVLVFSDDPLWCHDEELFADERFMIADDNSNYVDLCLMSMCSGHIIANSSFSWWGAWLADSKKVVAPSNWFGEELKDTNDTKDLYCKSWEVI